MKDNLSNHLTLLLWISLLASSFVVSESLLPYASPVASTGLRFILASLLMLPLVYKQLKSYLHARLLMQYSGISAFLVLFFIGMFEALKTTTALNTSVIYTLIPLFSVGLSYLWLNSRIEGLKLLGFLIGTGGALWVLLASHPHQIDALQWRSGDSIFMLASVCMAMHAVLVKKWGTRIPARIGAFLILLTGSLMLLPLLLFAGELETVAWQQQGFWQALLYLTLFTTLATFFLQQYLVQRVGPNRLLAFTYLVPTLVALPQGLITEGQWPIALPGIALTILALYLISWHSWQIEQETR
ncbi:MAG: DMT family transporter [Hahellaceae bacterium]|nr:DMT family transporter [Hahellaceae bacterium]MCP5168231.1 DMT family transporter [Hahellaceae bacterium]